MLPSAGNTPHDVLAVLRARPSDGAGEGQLPQSGCSRYLGAGITPYTSESHPEGLCASRSIGLMTGAGPSGNGCP